MPTPTEVANLALSHLGVGKEIANIETENSQEANACRRFYDLARESTLRDFNWPFATKMEALALVEEQPNTEWAYSYRYPTEALKLVRIPSSVRNDTRQTRAPYRITRDTSGRLIFTDVEDACMEYVFNEEDSSRFPSDFVLALSLRLAAYIAPRMTSGDPFKLGERAMKMYILEITRAQASALNEQQDEEKPYSEFINAREA